MTHEYFQDICEPSNAVYEPLNIMILWFDDVLMQENQNMFGMD